jgi:hypothetical protein
MLSMRPQRTTVLVLLILATAACCGRSAHAQAAVLMEEPYGFFGAINPTGHNAIYFANICAETPVKLRRCEPGEQGSVIARYSGIAKYDWVAMPLVPYLYSVEDVTEVPARVDHATVNRLRNRYHEDRLGALGPGVSEGNMMHAGWAQLVGVAYERRIYAFRFATTQEQDDTVIERLNSHANKSNFNFFYNNCADFGREVLNIYFPRTFPRNFFPDAGMTTPKQITYKLTKYSRKHPDLHLEVFEIPQVPGYRRSSRSNKSVSASLITTGYAFPIAIVNPYLFGALFVDYVTRGRFPSVPQHAPVLSPLELATLQSSTGGVQKAVGPVLPDPIAAAANAAEPASASTPTDEGLGEFVTVHE